MVLYNGGMGTDKLKSAKQMERHLKGISNHYRIAITLYLATNKNATLIEIIEAVNGNEKTIGEHVRRLALAGLVNKKYRGNYVEHKLSPYGEVFVNFLKQFQRIK